MADFYIKQNDTRPYISATLKDASGTVLDLTGASVQAHMRNEKGFVIVDAPGIVIDPATGHVRYEWQPTDTVKSGLFQFEFEVTYLDGGVETFPNTGSWSVQIADDIA